jgi:hypothetical protein
VFEKYGRHGAAMTAVVITYRTRMAVREMGKVLGLGDDAIDRLSKLLTSVEHPDDPGTSGAALREAGVDPEAPRIATLLDLVGRVRGLPRMKPCRFYDLLVEGKVSTMTVEHRRFRVGSGSTSGYGRYGKFRRGPWAGRRW